MQPGGPFGVRMCAQLRQSAHELRRFVTPAATHLRNHHHKAVRASAGQLRVPRVHPSVRSGDTKVTAQHKDSPRRVAPQITRSRDGCSCESTPPGHQLMNLLNPAS